MLMNSFSNKINKLMDQNSKPRISSQGSGIPLCMNNKNNKCIKVGRGENSFF